LALIVDKSALPSNLQRAQSYFNSNIKDAFILDGIQRLNTLYRAYNEGGDGQSLNLGRPIFVNVIICKSMDNLLYRMITLNNGQKPMTANHQIEILLGNIYKFHKLDIIIQTEKDKGKKGKQQHAFQKANIIKAYLAFLSNSVAVDNKKIIEEKLDELITSKIIATKRPNDIEFSSIINIITKLSADTYLKKWFDNTNNIIGFAVGIRQSYDFVSKVKTAKFSESIKNFELAFNDLDVSAIKLSRERRNLTEFFIANFEELYQQSALDILDVLNDKAL
jgi:hypothetical protein